MKNLITPLLFGLTSRGHTTFEIIRQRDKQLESMTIRGYVTVHDLTTKKKDVVFLSKERRSILDVLQLFDHKFIFVYLFCPTLLHHDNRYKKWSGNLHKEVLHTTTKCTVDLIKTIKEYEGKWLEIQIQWSI